MAKKGTSCNQIFVYLFCIVMLFSSAAILMLCHGANSSDGAGIGYFEDMVEAATSGAVNLRTLVTGLTAVAVFVIFVAILGVVGAYNRCRKSLCSFVFLIILMATVLTCVGLVCDNLVQVETPLMKQKVNVICTRAADVKQELGCDRPHAPTLPPTTQAPSTTTVATTTIATTTKAATTTKGTTTTSTTTKATTTEPAATTKATTTKATTSTTTTSTTTKATTTAATTKAATTAAATTAAAEESSRRLTVGDGIALVYNAHRKLSTHRKPDSEIVEFIGDVGGDNACGMVDDLCEPPDDFNLYTTCSCAQKVDVVQAEVDQDFGAYCGTWGLPEGTDHSSDWCLVNGQAECTDSDETSGALIRCREAHGDGPATGECVQSNQACTNPDSRSKIMNSAEIFFRRFNFGIQSLLLVMLITVLATFMLMCENQGTSALEHYQDFTAGGDFEDEDEFDRRGNYEEYQE